MNLHPFHAALVLLCASTFASADVVTLKDGRVLEGKILEDDGKTVKIKLKKGTMTLDHKDVDSIVKKATPEEEYQERLAKLDTKSASAQMELGLWAGEKELEEQAILHLIAAYGIDPEIARISDELTKRDYHLMGDKWCGPDTYYPSIGWIKFEGRWCSPAEHAYRLALKEVSALSVAREAAKTAQAGGAGKIKKIETRAAAERAAIDKIARLIVKAEADVAAAQTRFSAAEAKVLAASEKLTALIEREKPKEGDSRKEDSPAVKAAEKNLAAARVVAEKEAKALSAAKQIVTDQTTEKKAAEARLADIEKEKDAAEKESYSLESDVKAAQEKVDAATKRAEELKAAWEKAK